MKIIQVLLIGIILPFISSAQSLVTSEKTEKINDFITLMEDADQIGGAISISVKGQEEYSRTFGIMNKKYRNSIPETAYQVGSITKMFTAILIAQLVEENKLSFNTKLNKYFPRIKKSNEITIKQMLNHTSGLGDFVVKNDSMYYWLLKPQSQADIIEEIHRQDLVFSPGEDTQYSNSAYYLLARIVEKETQLNYKESLNRRIIQPLGLKLTSAVDQDQDFSGVAPPFAKKSNEWTETKDFHFLNASGVGDIFTTPNELNQFTHGLFQGKLISKETLTSMLPADDDWFGMGIMKVPFNEHKGIGHGGDTFGTHSVTGYFEDYDLAVTYCINAEHYPTNSFAIGVLSILFDHEYEFPKFDHYESDPTFYKRYAGLYTSDEIPISLKIYEEEDQLMAQGEGQASFSLSGTDIHTFVFTEEGVTIEFLPKENTLIFQQRGMEFKMTKK